jgi:hypothetical protein
MFPSQITKVLNFLDELDALSRKHGVWIETKDVEEGTITLVEEDGTQLATGLEIDENSQAYIVD